ncbi:MAG: hypothetical protein KJ956_14255, partial [Actinobacteria bacterium]|nr:hypothetical protein [Actinomycetota bacterium]
DEKYYLEACKLLKEDTKNFIPRSNEWIQGMSYRVHLELEKHNLSEALDLIKKLFENNQLTSENLMMFGINKGAWDLFLITKFLGYYKQNNIEFTIAKPQLQMLLQYIEQNIHGPFPKCNILKWIAFLGKKHGYDDIVVKAMDVVEKFEPDFVMQTISLSFDLFKCYTTKESAKEVFDKISNLEKQEKYFALYMEHRNYKEKFDLKKAKDWDLWDIVSLLPFYYS